MKSQVVGVYLLGPTQCQLVARAGTGGDFHGTPNDLRCPRMSIGIECAWEEVLVSLVHEALELALWTQGCRWYPSAMVANDLTAFLFVTSHVQFSEGCARAGWFLAQAIPALRAVHSKQRKRKTK